MVKSRRSYGLFSDIERESFHSRLQTEREQKIQSITRNDIYVTNDLIKLSSSEKHQKRSQKQNKTHFRCSNLS